MGGLTDARVAGQNGSVHAMLFLASTKDLLHLLGLLLAALLASRLVKTLDGPATLILSLVDR